ncbi:hypothetical protein BN3662_02072 [Clostridiales bacterium CHKCI006]|nr:hypothetical protein BN3662_02072 [Clostridiales bacterium CHKCI006]
MLQYVLIVIGVWLIVQIVIGTRQLKKQQDAMMQQMLEKQEKYRHIDETTFDETLDDELKDAIVTHIFTKEDEDYEHLKENLTEGEKVVYTVYLMQTAVDNGRGSVYQFFTGPGKEYLPDLVDSFTAIGCPKLADLMQKVVDLAIQEQSGQIADVDVDEEDDAPSFQTYTFDFMDLCEEEQIEDKLANYIRQHKATFLN